MGATVSYRTEFEAAYIQNSELNAHRYKLEVTVGGDDRYASKQQVLDYKVLGEYVRRIVPDKHWLVSSDQSEKEKSVADMMRSFGIHVVTFPYPLCIERLCEGIAFELQDIFDRHEPGVHVTEVRLRETADSFATWSR